MFGGLQHGPENSIGSHDCQGVAGRGRQAKGERAVSHPGAGRARKQAPARIRLQNASGLTGGGQRQHREHHSSTAGPHFWSAAACRRQLGRQFNLPG